MWNPLREQVYLQGGAYRTLFDREVGHLSQLCLCMPRHVGRSQMRGVYNYYFARGNNRFYNPLNLSFKGAIARRDRRYILEMDSKDYYKDPLRNTISTLARGDTKSSITLEMLDSNIKKMRCMPEPYDYQKALYISLFGLEQPHWIRELYDSIPKTDRRF